MLIGEGIDIQGAIYFQRDLYEGFQKIVEHPYNLLYMMKCQTGSVALLGLCAKLSSAVG